MHPQNKSMLRRLHSNRSMRSLNSDVLDDCSTVNDWEAPVDCGASSSSSQHRVESSIARRLNDTKSHTDRRSMLHRASSRSSRSSRHAGSSSASRSNGNSSSSNRRKGLVRTTSSRSQSSINDRMKDLTISSGPLDPSERRLMEMFEKEEQQQIDHRSLLKPRKPDPKKIKKAYKAVMADQDEGDKKMPYIERLDYSPILEAEEKKKRRVVRRTDPAAMNNDVQDDWGDESIQFLDSPRNSSPPRPRTPSPPREVPRQRTPPPQATPTMVEVVPGFELPLRGSSETQHAIAHGRIAKVNCMECTLELKCIDSAEFVLCPLCHAISPLECSTKTFRDSFGVGLGFVPEENM